MFLGIRFALSSIFSILSEDVFTLSCLELLPPHCRPISLGLQFFSRIKREEGRWICSLLASIFFSLLSHRSWKKSTIDTSYQDAGVFQTKCSLRSFNIYYLELDQLDRRICQYSELDSHRGLLTLHILAMYPKYLLSIYLFSIMLLVLSASLLMSLSSQTLRQAKKTGFGLSITSETQTRR